MHTIEKDWFTKAGLRAVVLFVNNSHRCGYVMLPHNHFLNGVDYSEHSEHLKKAYEKAMNGAIGKRGTLSVISAVFSDDEKFTPEIVFDVHGGITYAGGFGKYPVTSDNWWFGFDCAHWGDATTYSAEGIFRSVNYVSKECESLAEQIKDLNNDN